MNFYVMTLFPELITTVASSSIIGRAENSGIIHVESVNIRDYSQDKHRHVDDYPYGGGKGMLMQPQPVYDCYQDLIGRIGKETRVIYLSPQGKVFSQEMADSLALEENLIFLCGHYEGIDGRVIEEIVTDQVSIGDYVLTGGELPALCMIDAIARQVPGVLKEGSKDVESFRDSLLEYPQYTRPEEWMGKKVPEVLLSGHHKNIAEWQRERSIERTFRNRPDLLKDAVLTKKEQKFLNALKTAFEEEKKP